MLQILQRRYENLPPEICNIFPPEKIGKGELL